MKKNTTAEWLLLITTLTTSDSTLRTRSWRALKSLGASCLRDGVYLLPNQPILHHALSEIANEIVCVGREAQLLTVLSSNEQTQVFQARFDRSEEYNRWMSTVHAFLSSLSKQEPNVLRRTYRALQKEYEELINRDYFPRPVQKKAADLWKLMEVTVMKHLSPGEPHAQAQEITLLATADYQDRTWATRRSIGIDRLCSAWLIRRFIDPQSHFVWMTDPGIEFPRDAVGFDFDGAAFTHVGDRVTFEVLLASFDLEDNPPLIRLVALVHYLDIGGVPVPEAAGMATLLEGVREGCHMDDDCLLEQAMPILDAFYRALQSNSDGHD